MLDVLPKRGSDSGWSYVPLRYPLRLVMVVQFAMSQALETYHMLHTIYLTPEALGEHAQWYTEQIREDFMSISQVRITDPTWRSDAE